jgi:hypothetical protein
LQGKKRRKGGKQSAFGDQLSTFCDRGYYQSQRRVWQMPASAETESDSPQLTVDSRLPNAEWKSKKKYPPVLLFAFPFIRR